MAKKPAKSSVRKPVKSAAQAKPASPAVGGLSARAGKGPLWRFTGDDGSFVMPDPQYISGLYFPLCNLGGMKTSVTPDFKGDICADFHSFLTIPTDVEDLHRITNSRNFWVTVEGAEPWSATGVAAGQTARQWVDNEQAQVEAGIGSFAVSRSSGKLGLKAVVTSFVPAGDDKVELMKVEIINTSRRIVKFTGTFATPIFGRTADNLRDHRTVTTMFNRIWARPNGVVLAPTIHHDERGHTPNSTHYAVLGATGKGAAPKHVWPNMREFLGEGGKMDNPEAVYKNLTPPRKAPGDLHGQEGVGAMRFAPVSLAPGQSASFVFIMGITDDAAQIDRWLKKYGNQGAVDAALEQTRDFWRNLSSQVSFKTDDPMYGNWMRWVATQPIYRKVFGNSYLLDFGYGRGGRGWRDLWSDLLSIFLVDPAAAREEIVNNFLGIRVDGTNATIIGTKLGEFIADRNNIVRTWCDHGTWPWQVLAFYMHQTGDFDILLKDQPYWKDQFCFRSRRLDDKWAPAQGNRVAARSGGEYVGSIMEHILLELTAHFFHVGQHNNILLEGADWNDTYDGARTKGESVCFTSFYGYDLKNLADTLEKYGAAKGISHVELLEEAQMLLDRLPGQAPVDYSDWQAKRARLDQYMTAVSHDVSGKRVKVALADLVADLRGKAQFIYEHIRNSEFVTTADGESFFNGHYDNDSVRVHGDNPHGVRMDLTSQVFPTMFGVATNEQAARTYQAARRYLRDKNVGGLHLCTDLKELKLNLGRVAGFTYGYKEHGGIWNQMNVMYMNALYTRGMVREGYEVFREVYELATRSQRARTFPCIPSFFDRWGRGGYVYLTGSATWLVLATLTQVFGLRGSWGDLLIEPKLVKEQFGKSGRATASFDFAGKRLRVTYVNPSLADWGKYSVTGVTINGRSAPLTPAGQGCAMILAKNHLMALATQAINEVEVTLQPTGNSN
jgi:cellobiose phosphorylase